MKVRMICTSIHFYPRSPCGERQDRPRPSAGIDDFYPRSPCGERRISAGRESDTEENFYPRSPCGERQQGPTGG